MGLIIKLLLIGITVAIIYYVVFQLHLLGVILDNLGILFRSIIGYVGNMIGGLI